MSHSLVWLKRDLRWQDHAAMSAAARNGPFACLYVIEPALWQQPDMAASHYHFIVESLRSLYAALRAIGGQLLILHGDMISVLNALYDHSPFHTMHSHEETGNGWTYERDRQVAVWCREKNVQWQEHRQFGVVRGLRDRNRWQTAWEAEMAKPLQTFRNLCNGRSCRMMFKCQLRRRSVCIRPIRRHGNAVVVSRDCKY